MGDVRKINGRDVFTFDRHQEVLPVWVDAFRTYQKALPLITFDYHTDLQGAFLSYACTQGGSQIGEKTIFDIAQERLTLVDISDLASVDEAVADLRHDQHIDCAVRLGVIAHAFVFLGRDTYGMAHDHATVFKFDPCVPGCDKDFHDDDCEIPKANLVIDDSVLTDRVAAVERSVNLETDPYILDIDLDIFNTHAAIQPLNNSIFHRLIRSAACITIAREKGCVKNLRLDKELNSEYLENELTRHIKNALCH